MGESPNGKSSDDLGITPTISYDSNYSTTQSVKYAYVAPHTTKEADKSGYNAVKTYSGSSKYVTISGALPNTNTYSKYDLIITLMANGDTTKDTTIKVVNSNNETLKDITIQPPVRGDNEAKHLRVSGLTENVVKFSFTNGQQSIIYAVTLDYTKAVIDSDVYEWNFKANSELDIEESEFTITPGADGTNVSIDYDEVNGKYTKTDDFPDTLSTASTGVTLVSTEQLNEQYNKYTYSVTPQTSWFDEKETYTLSGNVYNSATGASVPGLTITATNGTGNVTTGTGFEVTGVIGSTDVTFSATGYKSKSISANSAQSDIVVDLIPDVVDDGTTEFSVNKILARNGYVASANENVDSNFNITVNNFKLSGNAKLQLFDSKNNLNEKDGYIGRVNLNANDATITYTPESDSIISISAMTGSGDDLERGVGLYQGSNTVGTFLTNDGSKIITKSYNVEAGKEYSIKRAGNKKAVNIYNVEFIAGASVPEFVGTAPTADTNNSLGIIKGDGEYYVYALVSADKLAAYDVIKISNGTNSIDVNEVYQEITFEGGSLKVQDTSNYMAVAYLDGVNEQPDLTGYTATFVDAE